MSKGHENQLEEVPTSRIWNKLSIKIIFKIRNNKPLEKIGIYDSVLIINRSVINGCIHREEER